VVLVDGDEQTGIGIFVFKGEAASTALQPSTEGSLEWVPRQRIKDLPVVEDLPALLERVLEMPPGQGPFSAHSSYNQDGELVVQFASAG
jgi:hypothetical protein